MPAFLILGVSRGRGSSVLRPPELALADNPAGISPDTRRELGKDFSEGPPRSPSQKRNAAKHEWTRRSRRPRGWRWEVVRCRGTAGGWRTRGGRAGFEVWVLGDESKQNCNKPPPMYAQHGAHEFIKLLIKLK